MPTPHQAISESFGLSSPDDDKVIAECLELCRMYDITPENLFYKWEALQFNASHKSLIARSFTMDSVGALKAQLQRETAANSKKQTRIAPRTPASIRPQRMIPVMKANLAAASRTVKQEEVSLSAPSVNFVDRTPPGASYKYMFETVKERGEALDDNLEQMSNIVKEHYKIDDFGDPSLTTDEAVTIIGRIALDAESATAGDVRLNKSIMVIEPTTRAGSGVRVPLKFADQLQSHGFPPNQRHVGFFPGAFVVLKGKNGGGSWFLVEEIFALPPLKPPTSLSPPAPFSMAVACGPYTPDTDLTFIPWRSLLAKLRVDKPSVTLLMGPFISLRHPYLRDGNIDKPLNEIFEDVFLTPLIEYLSESPDRTVLLLPSVQDAISHHNVYPQGPLDLLSHPRIHLLANPCHFMINGIAFGASSVDVLFHLRREELAIEAQQDVPLNEGDAPPDDMANLCRNLLTQRSFYPIFPVPMDLSDQVNLNVSQYQGLKIDYPAGTAPDVIITTSRLKEFSKTVDSTQFVHPGLVTKKSYLSAKFGETRTIELRRLD